MPSHTYRIYGFSSIHKVLEAESLLKKHDIPLKIVPRPASLGGADCGVVIRIEPRDTDAVEELFAQHGTTPSASSLSTDTTHA